MNNEDKHTYDDIVHLERPESPRRRMTMQDRAAQFASFAALSGYNDAVKETARVTDSMIDIDENVREQMDIRINELMNVPVERREECEITYFLPDNSKNGGSYISVIGQIDRLDTIENKLIMMNGTVINAEYIVDIQ